VLIIGANPRKEAALVNARIRKRWRAKNTPIAVIGDNATSRYKYEYARRNGLTALADLVARQGQASARCCPRTRCTR
jgi:NADH-quinone oxidoreductase subunit G